MINADRIRESRLEEKLKTRYAPSEAAITPGIPKLRMSLHWMPRLKISSFHIFPKKCMIPTKRSVCGKGKKSSTTGIITVDIPNPVVVPMTLAKNTITARYKISIRHFQSTRRFSTKAYNLQHISSTLWAKVYRLLPILSLFFPLFNILSQAGAAYCISFRAPGIFISLRASRE